MAGDKDITSNLHGSLIDSCLVQAWIISFLLIHTGPAIHVRYSMKLIGSGPLGFLIEAHLSS